MKGVSHVGVDPWGCPDFAVLKLSSPHVENFKHPYLTHTNSDSRNLKCYELSTSCSTHPPFRFLLLKEKVAFGL